jgi:hypothetical protein
LRDLASFAPRAINPWICRLRTQVDAPTATRRFLINDAQPSAWSGRGMVRPVCIGKPSAPGRSGRALIVRTLRPYFVPLICIPWLLLAGCSDGEALAQAEKMDGRGFPYTVIARKTADRYRVELVFDHRLLVSSYALYAGSDPATNATITWPQLGDFTVVFGKGTALHCSWSDHTACWEER